MTKKDFILIADVIRSTPKEMHFGLTSLFSARLKREYPNFDPITFRDYIEKTD